MFQRFGFACKVQEKFNRYFHRLKIANVQYPNAVRAILIRQIHLLPDLRQLICIDPFIRSRVAYIVDVVINPRAARSISFLRRWKPPNIAPVVVAPQQRHIIRYAHSFFVVCLHLFIESPYFWIARERRCHVRCKNLPLLGHDLFQQRDVGAFCHRHIAIAAHTERDRALVILVARNSLFPEFVQHRLRLFGSPTALSRAASTPAVRAASAHGATCPSRFHIHRRAADSQHHLH